MSSQKKARGLMKEGPLVQMLDRQKEGPLVQMLDRVYFEGHRVKPLNGANSACAKLEGRPPLGPPSRGP
jgi:hypothetical protein